ncbi:MAG TPA: glycosyltransferase [Hyphomicrobiaceae bacterium]|nr:glycosyltransferase [Hyphomicrobiaceae bacterium]
MAHTASTDMADRPASPPLVDRAGKVLVLAGTDRETVAHCRVLIDALRELGRETVVVADRQGLGNGLHAPDVGLIDLDCTTAWRNPLTKGSEAWQLARALEAERPDAMHVIGLEPAALACLALQLVPSVDTVVHLPDLAALEPESGALAWPYRGVAVRLLAALARKPDAFLLVGREEDLGDLRAQGIDPGPRCAVLGSAGVDPEVYPVLPPSPGDMPVAAFVGPVAEASGLRELVQAFERLWARGLRLQLEIHGAPDGAPDPAGPPDALAAEWGRWSLHPGIRCAGWPADTREVWRRAEICVWPVAGRQCLPRALIEAAACGRALLVTDTAGGRSFVRSEMEGLVVPPGDAAALGAALERLARDAGLRQRMGTAARLRVLHGFTEAHTKEVLRGAYLSLPGGSKAQ